MKLTKLKTQNFRGIRELEIDVHDFLTLIGPNNSGKSSILRAIEIFLNQLKPEVDEFRKNSDAPIIIEGTFEDIQEWERNKPGVSSLVNENKIRLRVTITKDTNDVDIPDYEAYIKPAIIDGWSDKWGDLDSSIKGVAGELNIDGKGWKTKANKERIRQYIIEHSPDKVAFGEAIWTSEGISIAPALKQAIPQAVIVHAVKDASDESKPAAKTSFGILLKKIVLPAIQVSEEYQSLINAVENLAIKMKGEGENEFEAVTKLAKELTRTISTILEAKVIFKIDTPDTDKFIGANAGINLDDGIELPIHLQGHGAQRALIYALVENLARQTAAPEEADSPSTEEQRSTILLFEEPEIYIHPHLMRRLKKSLVNIARRPDWQVIISTHSPFFINVAENPTSLVIMSKRSHETGVKINQLQSDPFQEIENAHSEREALRAALDFHPTVAEVFFANRIVLVEGDTELAVLRHSQGIHEKNGNFTSQI
ncbi:MAG: ATP-dependent nuclease [Planctomycetota bacterium]|jgi:ABC-type branched-subunit amino acid transport system ATPase component